MFRFIVISLYLLAFQVHADVLKGKISVIDGDTIEMHGKRIRLHGIDAPESGQTCINKNGKNYRCGKFAAQRLSKIIGWNTITCKVMDIDRYGRAIALCNIKNKDINEQLVEEGLALAYRQYSKDYVLAEKTARNAKKGLWQGDFIKPWDWRKGKRLVANSSTNTNKCKIKGNISSSGKIYHTPKSKWYNKTKINTSKGERWFCTEAEARAAGWRAPKN